MDEIAWIGVDWGTSSLRSFAVDAQGALRDMRMSDQGMVRLAPDEFEETLGIMTTGWLAEGRATPVIACGMVGARQGWVEAPYAPCPGPPLAPRLTRVRTRDARLDVRIVPGLAQMDPPDVMRGEETQVAGLLAGEPDFEGVVCLPGTHTKWVRVAGGAVTGFTTCMTGEVFALLTERSILRHSVGTGSTDEAAFLRGVEDGLADGTPMARLFGLRAADLLHGMPPAAARGRLSGLLIGAEVAGMAGGAKRVAVLGDAVLAGLYRAALGLAGIEAHALDATNLTVAGLRVAHERERQA